jgi:hypothetical protein
MPLVAVPVWSRRGLAQRRPYSQRVGQVFEGWRAETGELIGEPEGDGIEPVVRVRARGTPEFDLLHEFAKPPTVGLGRVPGFAIALDTASKHDRSPRSRDAVRRAAVDPKP